MTVYYPTDDLFLNISRGLVRGTSSVHKFGAVDSMSNSTAGTVWDFDDTIYPWSAFSSAGTIVVTANATENGKDITIEGLDSNYDSLSETVTVAGGAATTTNSFIRVFRAFVSDGASNTNDVTFARGATNIAKIRAGKSQTLMAIYTTPNGYTGHLAKLKTSAQSSADATGELYCRFDGQQSFRISHAFEVSGAGGAYVYDWAIPLLLPPKTDMDLRVDVRTNNGKYTAAFDIILVKVGLV
tara:strand:+ start:3138 stop:3860 length:723 start_codon:yes stop_codon:yes gene_type:complete